MPAKFTGIPSATGAGLLAVQCGVADEHAELEVGCRGAAGNAGGAENGKVDLAKTLDPFIAGLVGYVPRLGGAVVADVHCNLLLVARSGGSLPLLTKNLLHF